MKNKSQSNHKAVLIGLLTVVATVLTLTGCATASAPRSFSQLGQYRADPLNTNSFRIRFISDNQLTHGQAEEIALIKAAQTTVAHGFDYFSVVKDPSNTFNAQRPRQAIVYPNYPMFPPIYGRYRDPFFYDPFFNTPRVVNIDPIEVSYTIECFKSTQKNRPEQSFDARLILSSIGQRYGVNTDGSEIDYIKSVTSTPVPTHNTSNTP